MKLLFHNIWRSFIEMWHKRSGISLDAVRPDKLIYSLAYAFELMLFACTQLMPTRATLFGLSGYTVLFISHILISLVVMLLWSDKFKPLIYISAAVMLFGFAGFIFIPDGLLRLIFGIFAMSGLGGAVTCARCGFAFAANNAERLIGMTVMFFSVAGIYLMSSVSWAAQIVKVILPIVLAGLLTVCLFRFKENDFEVKKETTKTDVKGLYWALAFFIVYFAIDGYIWRLIDNAVFGEFVFVIIGMCLAGAVMFSLIVWCKLNVWHIWNIFFFFTISTAVLAVFSPQMGTVIPHYLFAGLSLIGWPLAIYMLACAQRRFASYALLKRCTIVYAVLSPLTTLSDDVLVGIYPGAMPTVTLVYVLVLVFALLVLSPYSYKHLFSVEWISDLHKSDMEKVKEKIEEIDRFKGYALTPRQREVAALLLLGKTRRQVSGELGLAESTVKMHTAELYKRLNINSRNDLFRIFGVAEVEETEKENESTSV